MMISHFYLIKMDWCEIHKEQKNLIELNLKNEVFKRSQLVSCRFLNLLCPTFLTPQRVLGEEVNYLVYKNFSTALHCSFIFFAFFNQFHGQKKLATWI